jgi:hypothetical protein
MKNILEKLDILVDQHSYINEIMSLGAGDQATRGIAFRSFITSLLAGGFLFAGLTATIAPAVVFITGVMVIQLLTSLNVMVDRFRRIKKDLKKATNPGEKLKLQTKLLSSRDSILSRLDIAFKRLNEKIENKKKQLEKEQNPQKKDTLRKGIAAARQILYNFEDVKKLVMGKDDE